MKKPIVIRPKDKDNINVTQALGDLHRRLRPLFAGVEQHFQGRRSEFRLALDGTAKVITSGRGLGDFEALRAIIEDSGFSIDSGADQGRFVVLSELPVRVSSSVLN